jgi:hypothetical protein
MRARLKPNNVRGRELEEVRELDPDGRIVGVPAVKTALR